MSFFNQPNQFSDETSSTNKEELSTSLESINIEEENNKENSNESDIYNLPKFPISFKVKKMEDLKPFLFELASHEYLRSLGDKIYKILFPNENKNITLIFRTAIFFTLFPNKKLLEEEILNYLLKLKFPYKNNYNILSTFLKSTLNEFNEFKYLENKWMLNSNYFDKFGRYFYLNSFEKQPLLKNNSSKFIVGGVDIISNETELNKKEINLENIDINIKLLGDKLLKLIFPKNLSDLYFRTLLFFALFPNNQLSLKNIFNYFRRHYSYFIEMKYHSNWKNKISITLFESEEFCKIILNSNTGESVWIINEDFFDQFGCSLNLIN